VQDRYAIYLIQSARTGEEDFQIWNKIAYFHILNGGEFVQPGHRRETGSTENGRLPRKDSGKASQIAPLVQIRVKSQNMKRVRRDRVEERLTRVPMPSNIQK
jgi:hypothetical protein